MSSKRNDFILYMFQQDVEDMKRWVLQYPNRETGGDLFGLWSGEGDNAVIHVVLGPGRGCTHGEYYFYQDVNYLEKVGSLLTENYMLGHIGEWHSHHQLQLDRPSEGDCTTIQRNYPRGSHGFFLMIANIYKGKVRLSPYVFKAGSAHGKAGKIQVVCHISPFSLVGDILEALHDGKENCQSGIAITQEKEKRGKKPRHKTSCMNIISSLFLSEDQGRRESLPVERKQSTSKKVHRRDEDCVSTRSDVYRKDYDCAHSETVTDKLNVASSSSLREVSECADHESQWYKKDSGQAILTKIVHELVADDITDMGNIRVDDDDSIQDMILTFRHRGSTVRIFFPFNFPVMNAEMKLDNISAKNICYSCDNMAQFNYKKFVTEIRQELEKSQNF